MSLSDFRDCHLQAEIGDGDVLSRALEVRHDVFVREKKYEQRAGCARDRHSLHLVFNYQGAPAGSVRLILANPQQQGFLFPFQEAFRRNGKYIPYKSGFKASLLAETSRLAVKSVIRAQVSQTRIADALILAALHAGVRLGLPGGYILVEPRLATHLTRDVGLTLEELGGPVNLNGERFAYWVPGGSHHHQLTPRVQDVFAWVKNQLAPHWCEIRRTELVAGITAALPKKSALRSPRHQLAA